MITQLLYYHKFWIHRPKVPAQPQFLYVIIDNWKYSRTNLRWRILLICVVEFARLELEWKKVEKTKYMTLEVKVEIQKLDYSRWWLMN